MNPRNPSPQPSVPDRAGPTNPRHPSTEAPDGAKATTYRREPAPPSPATQPEGEIHPLDARLMRLCLEDIAENCPDPGWAGQARGALPTRAPAHPTPQPIQGDDDCEYGCVGACHRIDHWRDRAAYWQQAATNLREQLEARAQPVSSEALRWYADTEHWTDDGVAMSEGGLEDFGARARAALAHLTQDTEGSE